MLSEEYLLAHNAEVLAGPIELSSCIDLCDQGGTATLTSPKLFKTRTRNFLLHIKTVSDPSKEGQSKTRGMFTYFHVLTRKYYIMLSGNSYIKTRKLFCLFPASR